MASQSKINESLGDECKVSISTGVNGWQHLPADLIGAITQLLCNDLSDLYRLGRICSHWRLSFKYSMNNNEKHFYDKLLSRAVLELYLYNHKYCNWIDNGCQRKYTQHQTIELLYTQYMDNIDKVYFDIFIDETDKDYPSKSFLWKSIAQEFTDNMCLFLKDSERVNKGICLPTYGKFKQDKYLKRIIDILQCLTENECVILCGYLLNILLNACKWFQWNKKASLYLKDCVIIGFGIKKYRNSEFCNNTVKICDQLSESNDI